MKDTKLRARDLSDRWELHIQFLFKFQVRGSSCTQNPEATVGCCSGWQDTGQVGDDREA